MIKTIFKNFVLMIQFLTRIPIHLNLPCEQEDFKRGTAFFSIVGIIVGGILWASFTLFNHILPLKVAVVLVIILEVLITGGLHLDGFGDTFDGFFAFKGNGDSKESVIEIMKDSRIGTYACLAIIFDILLKYVLLCEILQKSNSTMLIIPILMGKLGTSYLISIGNKAKEHGTGNLFIQNTGVVQLSINIIVGMIFSYFVIGGVKTVIIICSVLVVVILFNGLCRKKMGGISGDSLGANNEFCELISLIILSALITI